METKNLKTALKYRNIQVLSNAMNMVLASALLYSIIAATFIMSFGITGVIKLSWAKEILFVLVLLFLLFVNCAVGLLVGVGGLVSVYTESKKVINKLKIQNRLMWYGATSKKEFKWRQSFYISCSSIKIKLGQSNFLEDLTPLNLINNAVGLTVHMRLLRA